MRHDSLPRNAKLAARHRQQLARDRADQALRAAKRRKLDPLAEIEAALDDRVAVGAISAWLVETCFRPTTHGLNRDVVSALRRLLVVVAERSRLLDRDGWRASLPRLLALAHHHARWLDEPDAWRPRTYNVDRQFAAIVRHLLARYDVPTWLDGAWTTPHATHQAWFVHVAQGANLRTATGLPLALTKAMAHHAMLAPDDVTIPQALRFGQARGLDVGERLARAVLGTRIGHAFLGENEESFWTTFLRWLALHPMLDPTQVGPIVDYLHHQRFAPAGRVRVDGTFVEQGPAQPNLSMHRRCPNALAAQVHAWHRGLGRTRDVAKLVWPASGVRGYDRVEGEPRNQRRFEVVELCSSAELRDEGAAMGHCVATYARMCHEGRTAIFGVRVTDADGWRRRLTVEVRLATRQIAQARARHNAMPTPLDERIVRAWATTASLAISPHAWFAR